MKYFLKVLSFRRFKGEEINRLTHIMSGPGFFIQQ